MIVDQRDSNVLGSRASPGRVPEPSKNREESRAILFDLDMSSSIRHISMEVVQPHLSIEHHIILELFPP